jgi:hypothetical protein
MKVAKGAVAVCVGLLAVALYVMVAEQHSTAPGRTRVAVKLPKHLTASPKRERKARKSLRHARHGHKGLGPEVQVPKWAEYRAIHFAPRTPPRKQPEEAAATTSSHYVPYPPMRYNGGTVQHHPHVYVIFWGKGWNNHSAIKEKILDLYRNLANNSYSGILTQYFDKSGPIGNNTNLAGSYTDTREGIFEKEGKTEIVDDEEDAPAEVHYSINHQPGWGSPGVDDQYVLIPEPEWEYYFGEYCAFHEWDTTYNTTWTLLPYPHEEFAQCIPNYGASSDWQEMQILASHEWAESATDPRVGKGGDLGWEGARGETYYWEGHKYQEEEEIADLCYGVAGTNQQIATGIYAHKLRDNYKNSVIGEYCSASDPSPPHFSTAVTQPTVYESNHSATLHSAINSVGYPGGYQFELIRPEGAWNLVPYPAGPINEDVFYPFDNTANVYFLQGESTYRVKLSATSETTTSVWNGNSIVWSGGETTFTTPDWRPQVTISPATDIGPHEGTATATLHGTVDPQGYLTHYRFEWGEGGAFDHSVPVPDADIEAGTSPVAVQQTIDVKGLTEYRFRLRAENTEGTHTSSVQAFTTPDWRPSATTEAQSNVEVVEEQGQATLHGKVNPKGFATTYRFEWGTQAEYEAGEYGHSVPVPDGEAGAGEAGVAVQATIGVKGQTTYHYRLVAENAEGKSPNPGDRSFTTPDWRPKVTIESASEIRGEEDTGKALLSGHVRSEGFSTTYHFEWGTQAEYEEGKYGHSAPVPDAKLLFFKYPSGEDVQQTIEGLKGETTYHFRLVAENVEGKSPNPEDRSFTTPDWRPQLWTVHVGHIDGRHATLEARIDPNGFSTTYHFEWGTQAEYEAGKYGHSIPVPDGDLGSEAGYVRVGHALEGLQPHSSYHYRLVAENAEGTHTDPGEQFATWSSTFFTEKIPATVKSPGAWFYLSLGGGVVMYCGGPDMEGELGSSSEVLAMPFSEEDLTCFSGGTEEPLHMNGCQFEFEPGAPQEGGSYDGEFSIGPSGCGPITTQAPFGCLGNVSIPSQIGLAATYEPSGEASERKVKIWPDTSSLGIAGKEACGPYHGNGSITSDGWQTSAEQSEEAVGFGVKPLLDGQTTEADVGATKATLHATLYPVGSKVTYGFEYGATTEYGQNSQVGTIEAGTEGAVEVSEQIEGLEPGTTYHFRVDALGGGSVFGDDLTFTTGGAPSVTTDPATHLDTAEPQLNGTVNPEGTDTHYWFEYDTSPYEEGEEPHGTSLPVPPEDLGAGSEALAVSKRLKGLPSGHTYHYRVMAENTVGIAEGGDESFTVAPLSSAHRPRFEAGEYPATISGEQTAESQLILLRTGGSEIACDSSQWSGEASSATSQLSLAASFSGCEDEFGNSVSVEMNSCGYVLDLDNAGPPYTGGIGVSCGEEGDTIEVADPEIGVTLAIAAQSTSDSVDYENVGAGEGQYVHAAIDAEGLDYTCTGGLCFLFGGEGAHEGGAMSGEVKLEGADGEEQQIGFGVLGEETHTLLVEGEESTEESTQPRFASNEYPATISGEQTAESQLILLRTGGSEIACDSSQWSGEASSPTSQLSLDASFSGCEDEFGNSVSVGMNSCRYVFDLDNAGPPYSGGIEISCTEEGDAIEVEDAEIGITIAIGAQSAAGSVDYENVGAGGSEHVDAAIDAEGLHYSCTGSLCFLFGGEGAHEGGAMSGEVELE